MKQRLFLLCMLSCCALLAACAATQDAAAPASAESTALEDMATPAPAADRSAQMEEYGRLERLRMDIPEDAAAAVQANSFSISAQEVDALAREYQIYSGYDETTAREKALTQLIEQYAVYHYAADQGYTVEDALLDALIADEQDSDAENPKDFEKFLRGFDGDETLYRALQRSSLQTQVTIERFRAACQKTYEAEGGSDFSTYYSALVAEIVEGENVRLLSEDPT